jgi:hypothetical protein
MKKRRECDMFSEGNAANQEGCDSPQMLMAIWHTFFNFELAGLSVAAGCLTGFHYHLQ